MSVTGDQFINVSLRVPQGWRDRRGHVNTVIAEASRRAAALVRETLRDQIVLTGATATNRLLNSTAIELVRSENSWYTRRVGFRGKAAQYARFADKGRRAGKRPFSTWLYEWLDAVGLSRKLAFYIAKLIGERGTRGHYFFAATRRVTRPQVDQIMREARAEIARRLGLRRV